MNSKMTTKTRKKSGNIFKILFILGLSGTLLAVFALGAIYWHFSRDLPKIMSPADYRPALVTQVVATGGEQEMVIGEFFKERRYLLPYESIPDVVVKAFISAEDDRFFEHPGINILSIIRAGIANFKAGHVVQGGSTITQQVAKSLLLTPERSFDRKIKEVILASQIERNLDKKQILYLYLNQIYLGHGAYGVQAATRTYFKKDISEITTAEAAMLAGMPQAPSKYSPLLNPRKAKERQLYVLRRMLENKFITYSEMNSATTQALRIFQDEDLNSKYAPYYVEYVRKYLIEKYGEKAVYEGGLSVRVPVNGQFIKIATRSVQSGLRAIDKRIGFRGPLSHLKKEEEVEKFSSENRAKIINNRLRFQVLTADGRLDIEGAADFEGFQSDLELFELDTLYKGVITHIDSKKLVAQILIGKTKFEVPTDGLKWIYTGRAEGAVKYLVKGDVVWASILDLKEERAKIEQEPAVQGALFSMEVSTGNVLSMVGGYDFSLSEFNRAIQALRQPGSAFKPVIYASALEKGFTPASIIVDSPIVFKDSLGSSSWKPSNFEEKFYGDTTFRQALIKSRNIPTVKLVQAVQVPYLIEYARRLGITGQLAPDLSISLGSSSISLMDMTKVYSLFPRLGRKVTPVFISKIFDRDGGMLEERLPEAMPSAGPSVGEASATPQAEKLAVTSPTPDMSGLPKATPKIVLPTYPLQDDPTQVLDPRVAYVMTHLMKEVVTSGTGHQAKSLGRPAAAKTGTTNDYIDGWFMGFTPDVVTGVWVGFDSQKSIGPLETGARTALPIWLSYMQEAVKPYPVRDFSIPPGIVFATIDATTGKIAAPNSSTAIKEAFIAGTEPMEGEGNTQQGSDNPSEFFKEDRE